EAGDYCLVLACHLYIRFCVVFFVFFFQAEDGIRDGHVTGVQTCALPILKVADGWRKTVLDWRMSVSQGNVGGDLGFWPLAAKERSEERRVGKECRCGGGREE